MSQEREQHVAIPANLERPHGAVTPVVPPGQASRFGIQPCARMRVDAIRVYGPKGARVSVTSVRLPPGDSVENPPPEERATTALVTIDTSKILDDGARTVETSGVMACTVRNDGP